MNLVTPQQNDEALAREMMELLDQEEPLKPLQRGEVVSGVIMKVDQDGILVSIGHKAEGLVPQREMTLLDEEERLKLSVGDDLLTVVVESDRGDRPAILSLDGARKEEAWIELERCQQSGEVVDAKAVGYNRGGLLVAVHGVQGFIPFSQVTLPPRDQNAAPNNEEALAAKVGERLKLKVLELDRRRNRVVLTERQALQEQREQRKLELMEALIEGATRWGTVSGISNFGAFVDLGGADGLIHISELSWLPVKEVSDLLEVGQTIEVYVLRVDREAGKIALSLRRTQPQPWDTVMERFRVGQFVSGAVTNLAEFGAFARIEDSVEGLIHISELSHRVLRHPKEAVSVGDVLTLKILHIDPERRRMGLSLKQAQEEMGLVDLGEDEG